MNGRKIFNDPIYGLISFPYDILYQLIDHKYYQRLRRISQLGLTNFVYPGASHTRFHHGLGALHLMTRALHTLKEKNIDISDEECKSACIAILLHDIGHGPFSHALEHTILEVQHETLSLFFMHILNKEFEGQLTMAIDIFKGNYKKKFLHQLVSSQLDMDRMDYLCRDSYYTGVAEGVIGYHRIISMLHVHEDQLVIEEKGIYSIDKFLMARNIMYWQVYLHKTVLSAEQMLIKLLQLIKSEKENIDLNGISPHLLFFLDHSKQDISSLSKDQIISHYYQLDDYDIWYCLKKMIKSNNKLLKIFSKGILDRKLFKIYLEKIPFDKEQLELLIQNITKKYKISKKEAEELIIMGEESNQAYTTAQNEIQILRKNNTIVPFSTLSEHHINTKPLIKYFLCYPRI